MFASSEMANSVNEMEVGNFLSTPTLSALHSSRKISNRVKRVKSGKKRSKGSYTRRTPSEKGLHNDLHPTDFFHFVKDAVLEELEIDAGRA